MMRLTMRLGLLALAAFGAKTLYEKFATHKDELRDTGAEFVNRAGSAAREVGAKVQDATQRVATSAQESAADVSSTAKAQAAEVKAAAEDAMEKSLHETSDDEGAPRAVAG